MLTKKELAEQLKLSESTINRMVRDGCPHIKLNRAIRFNLDDVLAWMKSRNEVSNK